MSNVVSLRGGPTQEPPKGPNPDIIEELESLLAQARTGEIAGISGAVTWSDLNAGFFSAGEFSLAHWGASMLATRVVAKRWEEEADA